MYLAENNESEVYEDYLASNRKHHKTKKGSDKMVDILPKELKQQTVTFAVVTDNNGVVQHIGKSSVFLPDIKKKKASDSNGEV